MDERYRFKLDPSLEQLKLLPGGQAIYDYAKNKAEQLAAAVDLSVMDIIHRYELPPDPKAMMAMGYQIAIEVEILPNGIEQRRAVLYQKVYEKRISI